MRPWYRNSGERGFPFLYISHSFSTLYPIFLLTRQRRVTMYFTWNLSQKFLLATIFPVTDLLIKGAIHINFMFIFRSAHICNSIFGLGVNIVNDKWCYQSQRGFFLKKILMKYFAFSCFYFYTRQPLLILWKCFYCWLTVVYENN